MPDDGPGPRHSADAGRRPRAQPRRCWPEPDQLLRPSMTRAWCARREIGRGCAQGDPEGGAVDLLPADRRSRSGGSAASRRWSAWFHRAKGRARTRRVSSRCAEEPGVIITSRQLDNGAGRQGRRAMARGRDDLAVGLSPLRIRARARRWASSRRSARQASRRRGSSSRSPRACSSRPTRSPGAGSWPGAELPRRARDPLDDGAGYSSRLGYLDKYRPFHERDQRIDRVVSMIEQARPKPCVIPLAVAEMMPSAVIEVLDPVLGDLDDDSARRVSAMPVARLGDKARLQPRVAMHSRRVARQPAWTSWGHRDDGERRLPRGLFRYALISIRLTATPACFSRCRRRRRAPLRGHGRRLPGPIPDAHAGRAIARFRSVATPPAVRMAQVPWRRQSGTLDTVARYRGRWSSIVVPARPRSPPSKELGDIVLVDIRSRGRSPREGAGPFERPRRRVRRPHHRCDQRPGRHRRRRRGHRHRGHPRKPGMSRDDLIATNTANRPPAVARAMPEPLARRVRDRGQQSARRDGVRAGTPPVSQRQDRRAGGRARRTLPSFLAIEAERQRGGCARCCSAATATTWSRSPASTTVNGIPVTTAHCRPTGSRTSPVPARAAARSSGS